MSMLSRVIVALALGATRVAGDVTLTEFASFDLEGAAVASFVQSGLDSSGSSLLATTFSPTAKHDYVLHFTDLRALKLGSTTNISHTYVDEDAVWPNQADYVPAGSFIGTPASVLGAGGFFVAVPGSPSKSTGSVDLYEEVDGGSSFTKFQISQDKSGYFYHKAALLDANDDGLMDVIAARVTVPQYGLRADKAELVVMAQPPANATSLGTVWEETVVVSDGPDVDFALVDLDGSGAFQVVAAEYFVNQRLALYACGEGSPWASCAGGEGVVTVVIDGDEGAFFNVAWVDLNGDGRRDLLVTSQGDSGSGRVLAYEQPAGDWAAEAWTKHVLADGYKPTKAFLPGRGSPGTATPFPSPHGAAGARPWLAVSADDGGWVDVLAPASADPGEWTYEKTRVVQSTGTIGTIACGDVDGDGVAEIFVPLYDEGRLAMYSLDTAA